MGAIGGGIFQAVKGFRNAPSVSSVITLYLEISLKDNYYNILLQNDIQHETDLTPAQRIHYTMFYYCQMIYGTENFL